MTPEAGDEVRAIVNPAVNGGSDTARAEVVAVHGQAGERWSVDYRITLAGGREHLVTNATLYPDEQTARKVRNVDGLAAWPADDPQ